MKAWWARLDAWNERFKQRTHTYMVALAVVVGLLGGLGAVGFRHLIHLLEHVFWGSGLTVAWIDSLPWYQVLGVPTLGGITVGLLVHYGAREAKGHGVPEVIEAVAMRGGRIRPRVVAVKTLASGVCLASGGSVGREGPIVQIGAAFGSTLGQVLGLGTRRLRTIAGCGAAAGIAATFNAPIAGLLFVVEIILRDLRFAQFSPIVVAAVMATAVSREMISDVPAFMVPDYALATPLELPAYMVVGLLAGILGMALTRAIYAAEDRLEALPIHPVFIAGIGGAGVGCLALWFPEVLGNGYESIETVLLHMPVWKWMVMLLFVKIASVCLTLGSGGSGGIFAPSLFLGVLAGGLVGTAMNAMFPGSVGPSGAYALVGMGAVVAATTHAPLTAIIILFELTGDYRIILPLMIACTLATLLSARLHPESIYTTKLVRRGIHLREGRDANVLRNVKIAEIMRTDPPVFPTGEPLLELLSDIAHDDEPAYFVKDTDGAFLGVIALRDLRPVLADIESCKDLITAGDLADRCEPLAPEDTLDKALATLHGAHREIWPVARDAELLGSVHMEDILSSYRREVFKRDMATGMADAFSSDERILRTVGRHAITEIEAPARYIGKALRDLDMRARYGVSVLILKRAVEGEEDVIVPSGDTVVAEGDVLLVMGREAAVRRMDRG